MPLLSCIEGSLQCAGLPQVPSPEPSPQSTTDGNTNVSTYTSRTTDSRGNQAELDIQRRPLHPDMELPSKEVVMKAIEDFFHHIHPVGHFAFLHKASLIQGYSTGQTDPEFVFALCGLTYGILSPVPEMQEQAVAWIEKAESTVLKSLGHPSIFKIQSMLLIIDYRIYFRDRSSAFMLLAIAARFAYGMRLNYEDHSLCFLAQESRRRVMWALYILDTKVAGGLREFTACPIETINVQLPCREEGFELDVPQSTGSLESIAQSPSSSQVGLLTHYIRIMNIRDRILRYTKQAAARDHVGSNRPNAVRDFEIELQLYASTLPQSLIFSVRNLRLRAFSHWLPRYIMIHVWWHQCHCDLYRLLFTGLREAVSKKTLQQIDPDLIAYCQSRCVDHARAMAAEIFAPLLDLEVETKVMDSDIAVCAYQSARILFHAYRTNAEKFSLEEESTLLQTGYCSAVLEKFCPNIPTAIMIRQDIEDLITGGISSLSSASGPSSPRAQAKDSSQGGGFNAEATPRQILSRHSFLRDTAFADDSARLIASLEMARTTQPVSLQKPPTPQRVASGSIRQNSRSDDSLKFTENPSSNAVFSRIDEGAYRTVDEPLGSSNVEFTFGTENMQPDWSSNTAYQGAWGESHQVFDPLVNSMYYQSDWDMRDFMQGKWFD
ncbi:uncharacterized protein Z518_01669 [Rhinocladiella mackenziei CBS 650.93]|uniref:Xylanolytic transcriptional activator regulatory domain-containing protein n=1 Tax=Rhinocladiella mackenziei CBS 650.93 TaxID=1442369 RepID=A0A0D2JMB3_9EURO|nr:uncharacterized protein Z518_01669 [Rhinocladiella mackenziei CBS 650.93]KIX10585.1 hypothetical protein Z518_01669 [Rhinocladiella mackenziei CBS 650.93]